MNTLSSKLRATIRDHVECATPREIRAITELLCTDADRAMAAVAPAVIVATRFEAADKIVRDHERKLEWTRGNVSEKRLTWAEANEACEKLELAGGGWRLPTIKELLSLVDYERHDPAIDPAFECQPNWYWSSTAYASAPADCAWSVYFGYGSAGCGGRGYSGFVRAVRGGQF